MKQFNLEEYLKNPNRKLVTRDGKSVRIICFDRKGVNYPIMALIDNEKGSEYLMTYNSNGKSYCSMTDEPYDLFFAPEKKECWINIYKDSYGSPRTGTFYSTKEEALINKSTSFTYLNTFKVELEQ